MRNKGSKDLHGRYSTPKQMQARATKLAELITKFMDQAYRQHDFRLLTDFDKLHNSVEHLVDLAKLPMDKS